MRTLCLNLYRKEKPSTAENFLVFSPRVHYRDPGLVFLEVSTTASLFGGEQNLLKEVSKMASDFFPGVQAALSDSPSVAQLLCEERPFSIAPPNEELEVLNEIPLHRLKDLEGLIAWSSLREVEQIVHFFSSLGIQKIGQIKQFEIDSLRERWNETGSLLWKRLHGLDRQVISPLTPTESLEDYVHLDFPVSHLPFLLHCLEKMLERMMRRLTARKEVAQKIILQLFCEYSGSCHLIELAPNSPCRNMELYMKLLEHRLVEVSLENPIKEFKMEVIPAAEKIQQFDFWEPQKSNKDKLDQTASLFEQASLHTGFLSLKDEIFPENSWDILNEYEDSHLVDDVVEFSGRSVKLSPSYSKNIPLAPRPSKLLNNPKHLHPKKVEKLQFLSSQPIERMEGLWWEETRGRDYFFALSPKGQFLWVYYDRIEQEYFLHGYFD